jgi:GNAT superfamily N-acetyltransferase
MSITFRNNIKTADLQENHHKIRSFLVKLNNPNWLFGRWDNMVHSVWLNESAMAKIGMWEDDGNLVALAIYDCELGSSYFLVYHEYSFIKKDMLAYSRDAFRKDGEYRALINDSDAYFQGIAAKMGFIATEHGESDAVYHIDVDAISYTLPDGFRVVSSAEDKQLIDATVLIPDDKTVEDWERMFYRPIVDLNLKINIIAPNGDNASRCGMWYDAESGYALVEPVGTDENYRRLGLAKAAVLEGIKRCGLLGAKKAFVCYPQQFYYNIGFRPYQTSTWWKEK